MTAEMPPEIVESISKALHEGVYYRRSKGGPKRIGHKYWIGPTMRLAEALAERGDIDKKLRNLRDRAKSSARFVEGEEPPEDAQELLTEARELIRRHTKLVTQINLTNANAEVEPGLTVTAAIAERNRLSEEVGLLHDIANEASPGRDPYSRGRRRVELPEKTNLDVKELRREADLLAKEHRRLDGLIQQANWNTELQQRF